MAETYEQLLQELAETDDRIVVMTAENRSHIRNLPPKLGGRFMDVGICEQTMIGAAAGLALRGRIPITHALATFLTLRAFEFIRTDVGIANLPVKLVGAVPGFLSDANGPTHQAIEDVSLMRGIPNMGVFCPADTAELVAGMRAVIESPQPFYVRYNPHKPAVTHTEPFAIGKAEVLSQGSDVAILTYGFLLREAVRAREILEAAGRSVRLVNLRTLKPIDEAAVLDSVRGCALTVTLEDHFLTGGLYSIVAELLLSHRTTGRVLPLALRERWFTPGLLAGVLEAEGFTGEKIAAKITAELG
ncbi:MAG: transketolase C-terminal domain-containing protein [Minicystis sp.]